MSSLRKVVDLRKGERVRQSISHGVRGPDNAKRALPLRVRRRRVRFVIAGALLLVIVILVGAVRWLSFLPAFTIDAAEVVGHGEVSSEAVKERVGQVLNAETRNPFSRRNIFLYPRSAIEEEILREFPRIKSVRVSRPELFAHSLLIQIEERIPYAQWCLGAAGCYVVDESGLAFAPYAASDKPHPTTPYILYGGAEDGSDLMGQRMIPDHFHGLVLLLESMGRAGYHPQSAHIAGNDIHIVLEDFMVKVSFGQDVNALVKNLQLILTSEPLKGKQSEIEYIDLRFNNRVYYTLRGVGEKEALPSR